MKRCYGCQIEKEASEFHENSAKADGLRDECKVCRRKHYDANRDKILHYNKSWNNENRDRIAFHNRNRKASINGRAKQLWHGARLRALENNLEFDLCEARIKVALIIGKCERTGIDFSFNEPSKGMKNHPFAPSIDKVDPFGGYTYGNTKVVCWAYNVGKQQMSHDDFVDFCKRVVEFNK